MSTEKWNAYTADGILTETVLVRGEPIPEGLYHLVCEVLVRHTDGSYLCMKRSATKKAYPGYYEATAGGAALLGETKEECVKRELLEETGIACNDFTETCRFVTKDTIYYTYLCTVNCDKASVTLQQGETESYKWMTETEFISFINSDKVIPTQKERYKEYFLKMCYIK